MLDKIKEKFARLGLKDEEISAFEEQVDATNRTVEDEGLIARTDDQADDTQDTAPVEDIPPEEEGEEGIDVEVEEELLEEVAGRTLSRLVDPESPVMQALAELATDIQEMRATTTETLEAISGRLDALEQDEDTKRQRWLDDLPRGKTAKLVVRPRVTNAEPDEEEDTKPDGPTDYAAHAEAVLKEKGLST